MSSFAALEHLHPGHPVSLAVEILRRYPSRSAAYARNQATSEPIAVMRNAAIPGTADNIRAALELLDFVQGPEHHTLATEAAGEFWEQTAREFGEAVVQRGQHLAQEHWPEFLERLSGWQAER